MVELNGLAGYSSIYIDWRKSQMNELMENETMLKISKFPLEDEYEEDKNIELTCDLSSRFNNLKNKIEWYTPNQFMSNVKINGAKLRINNFNENNLGVYGCKTYLFEGALVINNEIDLNIDLRMINFNLERPKINLMVLNKDELKFNSMIKIECRKTIDLQLSHKYSIEWIRLKDDMPERSLVIENVLVIHEFNKTDLGIYSCIASNQAGKTIKSIKFYSQDDELNYLMLDEIDVPLDSVSERELDRRLKILIGNYEFDLGDSFAVECLSLCNLKFF